MELNNIIFSFLLLFIGYYLNKHLLNFCKKTKSNLFIDNQFNKPQAFHNAPTPRTGGLLIYILLIIVFVYLFFSKNIFFKEYISFCTLFFALGLLDDLKINIKPKFRLLSMSTLLIFLIIDNQFSVDKTGLAFLDNLMSIDIFSLFFICLCFLFTINGSNLIDGFNGLLGLHVFIISLILLFINLGSENYLIYILFYFCILILFFLKFNFPKAQIFLGDSGAYLIGSFIGISVINTANLNPSISPFFFCILLFYLFFEVFFSFFRKLFFTNQSPLFPDSRHLHMLLYKYILKKNKKKNKSNYSVSAYINFTYFLLIMPAIFFMEHGLFCRYYFFSLLIFYIYIYKKLHLKVK